MVLAALSVLLAVAPRLRPGVPALSLVAALALLRAALTPASVLGREAAGVETLVLVSLGVGALAAALALSRAPVANGSRVA